MSYTITSASWDQEPKHAEVVFLKTKLRKLNFWFKFEVSLVRFDNYKTNNPFNRHIHQVLHTARHSYMKEIIHNITVC